MKPYLIAVLAAVAPGLRAAAADLPAALAGRQLSLTNPDGTSLGTVQLQADGAAQMANVPRWRM
jgi:hypothetical protein